MGLTKPNEWAELDEVCCGDDREALINKTKEDVDIPDYYIKSLGVIDPFIFVETLNFEFGASFIFGLTIMQHVLKGFVMAVCGTPVSFIWASKNLSGPRVQIIDGVTRLPWAMKPVIGVVSDFFPIFGYHKSPYMFFATLVGLLAVFCMAWIPHTTMPVIAIAGCFFCINLMGSTDDLLSEALYAAKMREHPRLGPELMTYVWWGLTMAGIIAAPIAGFLLERFGNAAPYALGFFFVLPVFIPLFLNSLGDRQMSSEELRVKREQLFAKPVLFFVSMFTFVCSLAMMIVGLVFESVLVNAVAAMVVCVLICLASFICLHPVIAKVNFFFLIQTAMSLSTGGASFYFFTDDVRSFPTGPHFSKEFYTSVLGTVSGVCSLIGIACYEKYMKNWSYHSLLIFSNIVASAFSLTDCIIYSRLNHTKYFPVPDHYFVIGSSMAQAIVGSWMWMPGVVILSQLCPKEIEATMYALLAGCHNLGGTISGNVGALLLQSLGVMPSGMPAETHQFQNLWIASAVSTLLPCLTICLIPYFIPPGTQKEKILDISDPSEDSLWYRWRGRSSS